MTRPPVRVKQDNGGRRKRDVRGNKRNTHKKQTKHHDPPPVWVKQHRGGKDTQGSWGTTGEVPSMQANYWTTPSLDLCMDLYRSRALEHLIQHIMAHTPVDQPVHNACGSYAVNQFTDLCTGFCPIQDACEARIFP